MNLILVLICKSIKCAQRNELMWIWVNSMSNDKSGTQLSPYICLLKAQTFIARYSGPFTFFLSLFSLKSSVYVFIHKQIFSSHRYTKEINIVSFSFELLVASLYLLSCVFFIQCFNFVHKWMDEPHSIFHY